MVVTISPAAITTEVKSVEMHHEALTEVGQVVLMYDVYSLYI